MAINPANQNNNAGLTSGTELTLEQKLQKAEADRDQFKRASTAAAGLLSDPEVKALLEAKQRGVEMVLVSKADLAKQKQQELDGTANDKPIDLNEIDDNNTLANSILTQATKRFDQIVQQRLDPLINKVTQFEHDRAQRAAGEVDVSVKACQAKYQDFDSFRDDILQLHQQSPGLRVEEYYILAKTRKGSPIVPVTSMTSERPSNEGVRAPLSLGRNESVPVGTRGFQEILAKSQERRSKH